MGEGDGEAQPGQVVGKTGKDGQGQGDGKAGDRPGVDYYETDVTLDELIEIMFEDLELPKLERRALREIPTDRFAKRKGYRHVGIRVRLDKRRTARQRVKRVLATRQHQIAQGYEAPKDADGNERRFPFHQDDLRYKHLETDVREESNAAVVCIMDTSGSMDTMKKYLARSFFFLLYQFISTRYRNVEIVFIGHHTGSPRGHRGRVLPQGRGRRHLHFVGLSEGAGDHRRALSSVAVESLRFPLLRRRQLRLG